MTSIDYLMKRALELGAPARLNESTGMTFHPPVHGNSQGVIADSFARGTIKPGIMETIMPAIGTATMAWGMGRQMFGGGDGATPTPATPAAPPAPKAMPRMK